MEEKHPGLKNLWDFEKNEQEGIQFDKITPGSNKKVWLKCSLGHSYQSTPYDTITRHLGCPYCSHRKLLTGFNDLATTHPELLKEWDYEKNNKLGIFPDKIRVGYRNKVWWKCPNGHSYDSVIHPRTHGVGCPYCSTPARKVLQGFNDLATTNPELLEEWDYEKNTTKPTEITRGHTKEVWWKCKAGHSYLAPVNNRNKGGCPYCSGHKATPDSNLFTRFPDLAKEWDYEKNTTDPTTIIRGGKQKYWWKCNRGHSWEATVNTRVANGRVSTCPECAKRLRVSLPEKAVFYYLKKAYSDAEENYRPDWLNGKELDIFLPSKKIGIEYDGSRYHTAKRDLKKDAICKVNGITLIRIRENGTQTLKSNDTLIFNLPEKYKPDCSHIIPALKYLEKYLGINLDINLKRDFDTIRKNVIDYDKENCIAKTNPDYLSEWDYEENSKYGVTPENTSAGSGVPVYWMCSKGHSFKAAPSNRINGGTNCPYCSGKVVLPGFNDIATTNPELLEEWDYEKNPNQPSNVSRGSGKPVWWKCKNGHSFHLPPLSHEYGHCPYCYGRKVWPGFNDLATTHPELLQEWDYEKNKTKPTEVGKGHEKPIWWKCKRGHSYLASPNAKTSKNINCPYCSGKKVLPGFNDLATTNPELLEIWDYDKNKEDPTKISKGSGKKVWLKCEKGHSYETTIPNKLSGHGCNYCSGNKVLKGFNDVATTDPCLLKVWDDSHYSPYELSRKSSRVIECKCPSCNHTWTTKIYNLTNQRKCPGCKKNLSEL